MNACAVLNCQQIGLFQKFDPTYQSNIKSELLQLMVGEPEKSVAVALAGAVAVLTKTIFANNAQWPEIFNVLLQLSQDPNEKMRALNYELLAQVIIYIY